MTWPVRFDRDRISLFTPERISEADARRQEETASEILSRLSAQPGLVLADEVGMGKTFVALAVAASAAWGDSSHNPVVVMVPPSLKDKWPRDFDVFRRSCLKRPEDAEKLRAKSASNGVELFKLLDDPVGRRCHIVFVTHGALYRSLADEWTKLAILRHALRCRRLRRKRDAFPRFAAEIIQTKSSFRDEDGFRELLETDPWEWRDVLRRYGKNDEDEPVPRAICKVLDRPSEGVDAEVEALREALSLLPVRDSANRAKRILAVRRVLTHGLRRLWAAALVQARFRSPLLILDEAHHLKNPATGLASLFVDAAAAEDAQQLQGALQGGFERMLFLTATPFQLGHRELLNVLDRFRGIRWIDGSPTMTLETFSERLEKLKGGLDAAQRAAVRLDKAWGILRPEDLGDVVVEGDALESWWEQVSGAGGDVAERVGRVLARYRETADAMRSAESLLGRWVIRHRRSRWLSNGGTPRRRVIPGAGIRDPERSGEGLPLEREALLPFLLVARSQAVALGGPAGLAGAKVLRSHFAEGLASSFEAYRDTRSRSARRTGNLTDLTDEESAAGLLDLEQHPRSRLLKGYLSHLDQILKSVETHHPKVEATVEKVRALWRDGEKVLVFCHYRATGEALTRHLSRALWDDVRQSAAKGLGCRLADVSRRLRRLVDSFDRGRPAARVLDATVDRLLLGHPDLSEGEPETIKDIVRRFVRTEPFLVRYFPLGEGDAEERTREALEAKDGSGLSLEEKVGTFIRFVARRCHPEEREEYLSALMDIHTGIQEDADESEGSELRFPLVRLANGETKAEVRRRLLLTFNTPFFPEVLVASSVLAEGVDLHLNCRYVIHHDLCWNPSTLEQRTGRVDRIGAKAEEIGQSIHVYLPYVGGTQDEKMYRVVRDRERWFQVVMGDAYELDEMATERLAERVPLPASAARALALRLAVVPEDL